MSIPRDLVRDLRRLDEFELRRVLILVRGLLLHVDGPPTEDEVGLPPTLTYRQEHVRCGKDRCRTCPHGPYWYAYWKENGRTRKRYIGRQLPGEPLEPVVPDAVGRVDPAPSETGHDTGDDAGNDTGSGAADGPGSADPGGPGAGDLGDMGSGDVGGAERSRP